MTTSALGSAALPLDPPAISRRRAVFRFIGIFIFYSLLYTLFFSPVILNGKILAHGDGEAFFYSTFIAPKNAWTPNWLGGFPTTADPQTMSFYPPARLLSMLPSSWHPLAWNILVISAYVLGSGFLCYFILALNGSLLGGLGAGVIFGMSGFLVSHDPQPNMTHTAAWVPLMLLAVMQLRRRIRPGWIVIGALAVGMCILAGHPQLMVYALGFTGCYALVLAMGGALSAGPIEEPSEADEADPERGGDGRWRFLAACLLMVALGVALAAVQLLPSWQLSHYSVRDAITFANFTTMSFPPNQLSLLVFPFLYGGASKGYEVAFVGVGGFTEVVGYAGIVSLALAVAAVWRRWKSLHVRFFAVAAILAVLLAMGSYTPMARLMYHLPVFDLFRVQSRHYMEWTICVATLAGIGLAVLEQDARRRLTARWVGLGMVAFILAGCMGIVAYRGVLSHAFARVGVHWSSVPWRNPAIGIPLLLAILGAVSLWLLARCPRRWTRLAFLALLIADMGSFSFFLEWRAHSPKIVDQSIPSQLSSYRRQLNADHQRLAMVHDELGHSLHGRPNSPFAWGISSATGYDPLLLQRYYRIVRTDVVGAVTPVSLRGEPAAGDKNPPGNRAFDLLATRYILIPASSGIYFQSGLGLRADSPSLRFEPDLLPVDGHVPAPPVDGLSIISTMGASTLVADNTPVAAITILTEDGQTLTRHLRAGRDTAEQAWERTDVKAVVRHRRAPVAVSVNQGTYAQHYYLGKFQFQRPIRVREILIKPMMDKPVALFLTKLSLHPAPAAKMSGDIPLRNVPLNGPSHWRRVDQFDGVNVYENRRAMPRAWLVGRVKRLSADRIADSIVSGRLPDGTLFDPRKLAMVETAPPPLPDADPSQVGSARVLKITPTSVTVRTDSAHAAFLVLSDVNYPGWRATLDGQSTPIYQTDYLLRGVAIPAGQHTVHFVFRSKILYAGMAVSALAALILLWIAFGRIGKTRRVP